MPHESGWRARARELLERCDVFICLVGETTEASDPVEWEIREAHQLGKPILVATSHKGVKLPHCCEQLRLVPVVATDAGHAGQIVKLLLPKILFAAHDWNAGRPEPKLIVEQYNIIVQSWEALITRRQTVNSLYLSAVAALLAAVGVFVGSFDKTGMLASAVGGGMLSVVGYLLARIWRRTILSYGSLSSAKSDVVSAFERYLPAKVFDAEWCVLKARQYEATTVSEAGTATLFMRLFLVVGVVAVLAVAAIAAARLAWI